MHKRKLAQDQKHLNPNMNKNIATFLHSVKKIKNPNFKVMNDVSLKIVTVNKQTNKIKFEKHDFVFRDKYICC